MSIQINIYILKDNTNCLLETINQNLNIKFIDFKKNLLNKYFPDKNNLIINNITERIYKDYGLLFFNLGLLPTTNDNYYLSKFTIPNRTFSFLIEGNNIEIKNKEIKKSNLNNEIKKLNFNKYKEKISNEKNEFILNNDDFPPLG